MIVLNQCNLTKLFLHSWVLQPKFSNGGEIASPIQDRGTLEKKFSQLIWTDKPTEFIPGVYVTGSIPRLHLSEDMGGHFWQDSHHTQVDHILDDQALFIGVRSFSGNFRVRSCRSH